MLDVRDTEHPRTLTRTRSCVRTFPSARKQGGGPRFGARSGAIAISQLPGGVTELGDLRLATTAKVADWSGSRSDEEEGAGVTSEHLPRNPGQPRGRRVQGEGT